MDNTCLCRAHALTPSHQGADTSFLLSACIRFFLRPLLAGHHCKSKFFHLHSFFPVAEKHKKIARLLLLGAVMLTQMPILQPAGKAFSSKSPKSSPLFFACQFFKARELSYHKQKYPVKRNLKPCKRIFRLKERLFYL